ncbi:unnamed protein product [Closterium sp. Naga37s-1]|nr:unnamed protein product [Closterium sp. Naga37s-1]
MAASVVATASAASTPALVTAALAAFRRHTHAHAHVSPRRPCSSFPSSIAPAATSASRSACAPAARDAVPLAPSRASAASAAYPAATSASLRVFCTPSLISAPQGSARRAAVVAMATSAADASGVSPSAGGGAEAPPEGYRANVGVCVVNAANEVFVASRLDMPGAWQMPQGGIDAGEDIRSAALRELREETGISSALLLAETPEWLCYDFPPAVRQKLAVQWGREWKGQAQKWFLFRFVGEESEINLEGQGGEPPEFSEYKWLPPADVVAGAVEFKRPVYEAAMRVFEPVLASQQSPAADPSRDREYSFDAHFCCHLLSPTSLPVWSRGHRVAVSMWPQRGNRLLPSLRQSISDTWRGHPPPALREYQPSHLSNPRSHSRSLWSAAVNTSQEASSGAGKTGSDQRQEASGPAGTGPSAAGGSEARADGAGGSEGAGGAGGAGGEAGGETGSEGQASDGAAGGSDGRAKVVWPLDRARQVVKRVVGFVTSRVSWLARSGPFERVKKAVLFVREELTTPPAKRLAAKRKAEAEAMAAAAKAFEPSDRVDLTVVKRKVPWWRARIESVLNKVREHWVVQRVYGVQHHPIVTKSKEVVDEMKDRWETSDSPVVHRIQDLNDSIFGETATAMAVKEIRRRDPDFSLSDFIHEVQEDVLPVLNAYMHGDLAALKARCRKEVVERCRAERSAMLAQGLHAHHRILHHADVEVREVKLVGNDPVIILHFTSQQIFCLMDKQGKVHEGGKDNIMTMFHAWAMQQASLEDLAEDPNEPKWRLREMQQMGMQALI